MYSDVDVNVCPPEKGAVAYSVQSPIAGFVVINDISIDYHESNRLTLPQSIVDDSALK